MFAESTPCTLEDGGRSIDASQPLSVERTERDEGVEVVAGDVAAREVDDEEHEAHGDWIVCGDCS